MIISSSASDKAKYKNMIIDWLVAVCMLFFLHYIMLGTIRLTEAITSMIDSSIDDTWIEVEGDNTYIRTNLMGAIRFQAERDDISAQAGYTVLYIMLVAYSIMFGFKYLKRVVNMAFLTIISPVIVLTYPIDKMNDGKAQGFDIWLKEYIFNALLQPLHLIIYLVLVGNAASLVTVNPIYAIVALAFISQAEKFLRKIFNFDKASAGTLSAMGFAGGATAMGLLSRYKSKGFSPSKQKTKNLNENNSGANSGRSELQRTNSGDYGSFLEAPSGSSVQGGGANTALQTGQGNNLNPRDYTNEGEAPSNERRQSPEQNNNEEMDNQMPEATNPDLISANDVYQQMNNNQMDRGEQLGGETIPEQGLQNNEEQVPSGPSNSGYRELSNNEQLGNDSNGINARYGQQDGLVGNEIDTNQGQIDTENGMDANQGEIDTREINAGQASQGEIDTSSQSQGSMEDLGFRDYAGAVGSGIRDTITTPFSNMASDYREQKAKGKGKRFVVKSVGKGLLKAAGAVGRVAVPAIGAVAGATAGLALGATTGDLGKAMQGLAVGAGAGIYGGRYTTRKISGATSFVGRKAEEIRYSAARQKLGYSEALKARDAELDEKQRKQFLRDKENIAQAKDLAAKLGVKDHKSVLEDMYALRSARVNDDKMIEAAMKVKRENKLSQSEMVKLANDTRKTSETMLFGQAESRQLQERIAGKFVTKSKGRLTKEQAQVQAERYIANMREMYNESR